MKYDTFVTKYMKDSYFIVAIRRFTMDNLREERCKKHDQINRNKWPDITQQTTEKDEAKSSINLKIKNPHCKLPNRFSSITTQSQF
jgi:hypothetical protein